MSATPAENVRTFLASAPHMVTVGRLATYAGDHTLTVADLGSLILGSTTKAQERAITVYLDAHDHLGDGCPVVKTTRAGAKLLAADVRALLDDLDPDRLDNDDVIDIQIEWPEGAEDFRITRHRLGELLALLDAAEVDDLS
ncbi:hypothetical protein ACFVXQ_15835 [Kitasatospora sp. NPDC058263]